MRWLYDDVITWDSSSIPPATIICSKMMIFLIFYKSVTNQPTDGRTDQRTDGPTDGRADRPSYRDARTHLKRQSDFDSVWTREPGERSRIPDRQTDIDIKDRDRVCSHWSEISWISRKYHNVHFNGTHPNSEDEQLTKMAVEEEEEEAEQKKLKVSHALGIKM